MGDPNGKGRLGSRRAGGRRAPRPRGVGERRARKDGRARHDARRNRSLPERAAPAQVAHPRRDVHVGSHFSDAARLPQASHRRAHVDHVQPVRREVPVLRQL